MDEPEENNLEEQLAELRSGIDAIDQEIVDLINKRLCIGQKIGNIKQERGSKVLDPNRERKVLEHLEKINSGPLEEDVLRYIFSVIMTATRQIQKSQRISYLGPEASYTHIAALKHFRHSGLFVEETSIRDIFSEVERKESHFGVVPVENSIEGAVNHTLDLFQEFNLHIQAEHFEKISHDLLSVSGKIQDIKKIVSHPQALAQCRGWIRRKFPDIELVETSSTSNAAKLASEDITAAAIASSRAAHIYGLQIVESKLEDYSGNVTRFLIIGHEDSSPTGKDKTSIMFATSHVPGALFRALEPVNRSGLNMVKLESRPMKDQNWSYFFFMDIEGHIQDKKVAQTLEAIQEQCLYLKHLGSYPVFNDWQ